MVLSQFTEVHTSSVFISYVVFSLFSIIYEFLLISSFPNLTWLLQRLTFCYKLCRVKYLVWWQGWLHLGSTLFCCTCHCNIWKNNISVLLYIALLLHATCTLYSPGLATKYHKKVKLKCTLVQALRLCTGSTVHRESRCIALLFHDHGTRRRWGVSVTPRPLFTPGKTRYLL